MYLGKSRELASSELCTALCPPSPAASSLTERTHRSASPELRPHTTLKSTSTQITRSWSHSTWGGASPQPPVFDMRQGAAPPPLFLLGAALPRPTSPRSICEQNLARDSRHIDTAAARMRVPESAESVAELPTAKGPLWQPPKSYPLPHPRGSGTRLESRCPKAQSLPSCRFSASGSDLLNAS